MEEPLVKKKKSNQPTYINYPLIRPNEKKVIFVQALRMGVRCPVIFWEQLDIPHDCMTAPIQQQQHKTFACGCYNHSTILKAGFT